MTTRTNPVLWGLPDQFTVTRPADAWIASTSSRMAILAAGALTASCILMVPDVASPVAFFAHEVTTDRAEATSGLLASSTIGSVSSARALRETKERSGLTWDQLANAFGVSRRAVHGWASGARMNARHSELLLRLRESLRNVEVPGDPESTRTALLQAIASVARTQPPVGRRAGVSPLDLISVGRSDEEWSQTAGDSVAIVDSE